MLNIAFIFFSIFHLVVIDTGSSLSWGFIMLSSLLLLSVAFISGDLHRKRSSVPVFFTSFLLLLLILVIDTWKAIAFKRVFLSLHTQGLSKVMKMNIMRVCVRMCEGERRLSVRGLEERADVNYLRARITLNDSHWSLLEWFCSHNKEAVVNHRYMMRSW